MNWDAHGRKIDWARWAFEGWQPLGMVRGSHVGDNLPGLPYAVDFVLSL